MMLIYWTVKDVSNMSLGLFQNEIKQKNEDNEQRF